MNKSYEKINYFLRPKKQIERKLIIETFQKISNVVEISKYHYFGFGSIYFADFILFHKLLNIQKMTSIDDKEDDKDRFLFNKPYGFIDFQISDINDFVVEKLNWNDSLFIWLDYDGGIDEDIITTTTFIASKAKLKDIFFITLNSFPPKGKVAINEFKEVFKKYLKPNIPNEDFIKNYPKILMMIINECIKVGLNNQVDIKKFIPIFNLKYKDGAPMYTFGGIFYNNDLKPDVETLKTQISELNCISYDDNIISIDCPILTPKEKIFLDAIIEGEEYIQNDINIGIDAEKKDKYIKYYRYYPQFYESVF